MDINPTNDQTFCNKENYRFAEICVSYLFFSFFRCYQVPSNSMFQPYLSFSCQKPLILLHTFPQAFLYFLKETLLEPQTRLVPTWTCFSCSFPPYSSHLQLFVQGVSLQLMWASCRLVQHYHFGTYMYNSLAHKERCA